MSIRSQIQHNIIRSYLFMVVFILFIVVLTYIFSHVFGYDSSFIGIALVVSAISSIGSLYVGDSIVLAMTGAKSASRQQHFDFYTVAENISLAAGIPMPKLYVIEDASMNAFATGRDPNHASVCVTTGLLKNLNRREVEGVVAHELSHIKNYDIRLMAVVAVLAGGIAFASDMFMRNVWWSGNRDRESDRNNSGIFILIGIVLAVLSPIIASLIQLAVSRKREYLADATGVFITRYPEGLASALEKIGRESRVLKNASNATAHLFIANPFKNKKTHAWFSGLFNTHPPIEDRIKILRTM